MMHANSEVNLVNKVIRFPYGNQHGAPSLLDHFYTNQISKIKNIGLLVDDISNHFPTVATIRLQTQNLFNLENMNYLCPYIIIIKISDTTVFGTNLFADFFLLQLFFCYFIS